MPAFSSLLTLLDDLAGVRSALDQSLLGLLRPSPADNLLRLLSQRENANPLSRLGPILQNIADMKDASRIERHTTDWPFQHFWNTPTEPRHSKLLGYFLNPAEEHGCGTFLLEQFVDLLAKSRVFPQDWCMALNGCEVSVEADYIDLLILRDQPDGRYAIIIENKINGAVDQDEQLSGYAAKLLNRGFDPKSILALYLPLNGERAPTREDQTALRSQGVLWRTITFEQHILPWITAASDKVSNPKSPEHLTGGMRQNLSHYRNLLTYLLNQNKEIRMQEDVLDRLRQAQAADELPTWQQVQQLKSSAETLQRGLETVLRGQLLLAVKARLEAAGFRVELRAEKRLSKPLGEVTSFDQSFWDGANVCVLVDESVSVCLGGNAWESWTGYMRNTERDEATGAKLSTIVEAARRRYARSTNENDPPWYKWGHQKFDYSAMAKPSMVDEFVELLKDMHNELQTNFGQQKSLTRTSA